MFSTATQLGAVIADVSSEIEQKLAAYGQHLGVAFQLIDDALDYKSTEAELGKNLGDDLAEGKITLPLIHAMRHGSEAEQQLIKTAIKEGNRGAFNEVLAIVKKTDAITYTEQRADEQAQLAINALDILNDSEFKQAMILLAKFSVQRSY